MLCRFDARDAISARQGAGGYAINPQPELANSLVVVLLARPERGVA